MSRRRKIVVDEGGQYQIIEEEVVASGPWQELIDSMQKTAGVTPVLLPHEDMGCAAFAMNQKGDMMYLIYIAPKRRPLKYRREDTGEDCNYKLALPHTYIGIRLVFRPDAGTWAVGHTMAFVARQKLKTIDDRIGPLPMPNVDYHGRLCTGSGVPFTDCRSPQTMASDFAKHFVNSGWTAHIMEWVPDKTPAKIKEKIKASYNAYIYEWCKEYLAAIEKISKEGGGEAVAALDWPVEKPAREYLTWLAGVAL